MMNIKQAADLLEKEGIAVEAGAQSIHVIPKHQSFHLTRVSQTESKVQFIGENNQEVFETTELQDWVAYSAMFDFVYLLSLLEETINRYVKTNPLMRLTEKEIAAFITA
ncbi:hypothetical protein [Neobacillus muris]|uniref:hypothetical protein n=1 Tax=Neobacillus muris TaxID=2941334 RepID=UPI00203C141E|nr:hypothetical protein [Neobacillus muris]